MNGKFIYVYSAFCLNTFSIVSKSSNSMMNTLRGESDLLQKRPTSKTKTWNGLLYIAPIEKDDKFRESWKKIFQMTG